MGDTHFLWARRSMACRGPDAFDRLTPICVLSLLSGMLLMSLFCTSGFAQVATSIVPDGTLRTQVTQDGAVHAITGGTSQGANLFHSFTRFTVGTGETARFTAPEAGIQNIISRVTGGQQSVIDGLLQSDFPDASLYLLNPSGVLFGANARLMIQGSLFVSTARALRFADDREFTVALGNESDLSVAAPAAFGFIAPTPADITVQGSTLRVPLEATLALVGGDIAIAGGRTSGVGSPQTLAAPRGQLIITSVAAPGTVPLSPVAASQATGPNRGGTITLTDGARLLTSDGGLIQIRGGRLMLDDQSSLATTTFRVETPQVGVSVQMSEAIQMRRGSNITTLALNVGRGADIELRAPQIQMQEGAMMTTSVNGKNPGGDVRIEAGTLQLTTGAVITNDSTGSGDGGDVVITATEVIAFSGRADLPSSGISLLTTRAGTAGNVRLATPQLTLEAGAVIETISRGPGRAGNVEVETERLTVTAGAEMSTSTFGPGPGGEISITATDTIRISGREPTSLLRSGLFSQSGGGAGAAGQVTIVAPEVLVDDGASIAATTSGAGPAGAIAIFVERLTVGEGAQIDTSTFGAGAGGTVRITASGTLAIAGRDSGLLAAAFASGPGGDITLQVGRIHLGAQAMISAASTGLDRAGTVSITASGTFQSESSIVSTQAQQANGGSLDIVARSKVVLRDSTLMAVARGGSGTIGGDIVVTSPFLVLANSQVIANAPGAQGANVAIPEGVFLADPNSVVQATGTVDISALIADLSGQLAPLRLPYATTSMLLRNQCAGRLRGDDTGRFVIRPRDRAPLEPGGVLPTTAVPATTASVSPVPTSSFLRVGLSSPHHKMIPMNRDCLGGWR